MKFDFDFNLGAGSHISQYTVDIKEINLNIIPLELLTLNITYEHFFILYVIKVILILTKFSAICFHDSVKFSLVMESFKSPLIYLKITSSEIESACMIL